jgi:hypothetical protein
LKFEQSQTGHTGAQRCISRATPAVGVPGSSSLAGIGVLTAGIGTIIRLRRLPSFLTPLVSPAIVVCSSIASHGRRLQARSKYTAAG